MKMLLLLLTPRRVLMLLACAAVLRTGYEYLHRKTHRAAAFLLGTGSGIAALLLAHFYGSAVGFTPPVTLHTLFVSAAAGIPGVILLYLLRL